MLAACDAAGVRLGVAVPGHDEPLFEQIRRMIGSDWLGGPVCLQALAGDDALLRDPPRDGDPRVEPRLVGENPFVQLAARHVHLASWLVGRAVVQVTAQTARGFLPIAADGGVATARLRGNVLCTFACSHLTAASELAVHGTDGGVRIDADRIWLRGRQAFHGDVFDYAEPDAETVFPRRELDPVQTRLRPGYELHGRFARWLDDCDDFPCPGDQALIDMRVVDAMARAAALGRAVAVE
jgi:predicted dehydrogenase